MYKRINNFLKSQLEKWINRYIESNFQKYLEHGYFDERIKDVMLRQYLDNEYFDERIKDVTLNKHLIFGDAKKLKLSDNCVVNNAIFNLSSGYIEIGEYVFFGHHVSLITGTHNYNKFGRDRMSDYPKEGNDIVVEEGAWIASNVTVLGPCRIGKHSVISAGAVVKGDVPSYHVVAGIPARTIKELKPLA